MSKKVYFYTIDLFDEKGDNCIGYLNIKKHIVDIVEQNALSKRNFKVLDLSTEGDLHLVADIFNYEDKYLFLRMSSQKPTGSYLHRNYETYQPSSMLEGSSEDKEGIEIYTYTLLDYETGILSIVNQKGAPSHKLVKKIFEKYSPQFILDFLPVPNKNGINKIYNASDSKISIIEIEVPVPDAGYLESCFGWNPEEILDVQNGSLKASIRISGVERSVITEDESQTRSILQKIKDNLSLYRKASIRARADGLKTQDYNFFDDLFSFQVDIHTYSVINGNKHYLTADELVAEYKKKLIDSFNENKILLKGITNR